MSRRNEPPWYSSWGEYEKATHDCRFHEYDVKDAWWSGFIIGAGLCGGTIVAVQVLLAVLS